MARAAPRAARAASQWPGRRVPGATTQRARVSCLVAPPGRRRRQRASVDTRCTDDSSHRRDARSRGYGPGRRGRCLGPERLSSATGQRVSADRCASGSHRVPGGAVRVCRPLVQHGVSRSKRAAVRADDLRVPACAVAAPARAATVSLAGDATESVPRPGRDAFPGDVRTFARPRVARRTPARALYRRDDSGCRRHGQDLGVHVSVRRAASALARPGSRPQGRRTGARSERGFLQAGARDS